jgi:hypothetical protein
MSDRRNFTKSEKEYAWEKADTIPGRNPDYYRADKAGNVVSKPQYGKDSDMGYNIDHSKPLAENGTYHKNNIQVLQTSQNKSKGSDYPYNYSSEPQRGISAAPVPDVDLRSSATRSGDLHFKPDGTVNRNSSAVRDGSVLVTKDGHVDGRSAAVKDGSVKFK